MSGSQIFSILVIVAIFAFLGYRLYKRKKNTGSVMGCPCGCQDRGGATKEHKA